MKKKFSVYLPDEAVECLFQLVFNDRKNGLRSSQSKIISHAIISYHAQRKMAKQLDEMETTIKKLSTKQMTHYENDECYPPCKIDSTSDFWV